jgi:hypothetical protein
MTILSKLEFEILRLFIKNRRWSPKTTIINMIFKHKHFSVLPLLNREIDTEKTRFQKVKTKKMTISHDVRIRNFEDIYEKQMMAHIKNNNKYDFQIPTILPFYLLYWENSMWKYHLFSLRKGRKWQFLKTLKFKILR